MLSMQPVVIIMLPRNSGLIAKRSSELNRDIESLLQSCSNDDNIKKLLMQEIINEIRRSSLKKMFKIVCILTFVMLQVYMIPSLSWNASAIGRIVMIKMLSVWDWKYLYTVDCLIERNVKLNFDYNHEATDDDNECIFCENIEEIHHVWDISYADLKSNYLNRGHPVVVEEPQLVSQSINLDEYVAILQNLTNLIESHPCNLQTNLITGYQSKSLNALLELTIKSSDGWFLHFRNCDFDAVKASRILEQQPYFFTSHLKPFSSSWILMSNSYKVKKPKKLLLKHSVVVKQIIGSLEVLLEPKEDCKDTCKDYLIRLEVGLTVVFSADHWDFHYVPSDGGISVTYIREYEMNI